MNITNIISLLGGVALFLFGMSLMGDGLKKVAGNKLEVILYRLSDTPLKGVLLGTGVTAVIQSSSATSVMVVGFVNSGMMKFEQAISVIHGALIGTSITGWIICLSSIEGTGWVKLFSTSTIAAVVAIIGIILRMFPRKASHVHIGDILLGFGVLMYGMQAMTGAVAPLKQSPAFIALLTTFTNPFIGIIVGAAFTAVLQSASAALGILQALSMTGAMTFSTGYPIILGIAVGASVPVMLSAMGAKTPGRRTAFVYPVIEVIAVIIFALAYYIPAMIRPWPFADIVLNPVNIALFNTLFRVSTAVVLMPFNKYVVRLTQKLVPAKAGEKNESEIFDRLSDRFVNHPATAIEQSKILTNELAELAIKNFNDAASLLDDYNDNMFKAVEADEELCDKYEDKIGTYLIKISGQEMTHDEVDNVTKFLHTLSDFERISDHALNVAELAKEIRDKKIKFSEDAQSEIKTLLAAINEIMTLALRCFQTDDLELAYMVEPLEEQIDFLTDTMKLRHVERMQAGKCSLLQGFVFNDLLTNCERVADHASNVAVAVIETGKDEFDTHDYVNNLKELHSHNFDAYLEKFAERYKI